jgi:hypothetical protein
MRDREKNDYPASDRTVCGSEQSELGDAGPFFRAS